MAPTQATAISLRCKVPPGHIAGSADEFLLGVFPISTRIGELRQRIQQQIPGNPAPPQQRILYGGRALVDDEVTLADALNVKRDPTQEAYVIHLLIRGDNSSGPQPSQRQHAEAHPPRDLLSNGYAPHELLRMQQQQMAQMAAAQQRPFAQHAAQHQHVQPGLPHQHLQAGIPHQHPLHNAFGPARFPFGVPGLNPGFRAAPPPHGQPGINVYGPEMQAPTSGGQQTPSAQEQGAPPPRTGDTDERTSARIPVSQPQGTAVTDGNAASSQVDGLQPTSNPLPNGPSAPQRPISSQGFHMEGLGQNGQRITVHHQTFSYPMGGVPPGLPVGMPMVLPFPHLAGPPQPGAANMADPPAQTRTREAVQRMQSILDQLETRPFVDDEQRAQIEALRRDARLLQQQASVSGAPAVFAPTIPTARFAGDAHTNHATESIPVLRSFNDFIPSQPRAQSGQRAPSTTPNPSATTCYLLSSPSGPRAILYSPQHGTYLGSQAPQPTPASFPWPSNITPPPAPNPFQGLQQPVHNPPGIANPPAAPQNPIVPVQGGQIAPAEPIAPLQMILGHFWLLLRITIFAYFLLGSNMGWRRPLLLVALGVGFWIVRMGLLGENGALRRWWDDVMRGGPQPPPPAAAAVRNPAGQQPDAAAAAAAAPPAAGGRAGGARRMPTPEEVAQRILNERAAAAGRNGAPRLNPQAQWLRDQVRPVERAAALFIGSLWPGVGEAAVRAREAEDRRRAEEEVAARRHAEEAARVAAEEGTADEKKEKGQGEDGDGVPSMEETEKESETASSASLSTSAAQTGVVD